MKIDEQQAAILSEHKGSTFHVDGYGLVTVKPLTMEQILDPQTAKDVIEVATAMAKSLDHFAKMAATGFDAAATMALLGPVLSPLKRLLAMSLDAPLGKLPHWGFPEVLQAFLGFFTQPLLAPWVGLIRGLQAAGVKNGPATGGGGVSPTPSSSSSVAATPDGGATPPISSSSSSGLP